MEYKKITAEDIAGKGVVGQADTPLLSALEMQNKVEEVPRAVIIPHFNSLIDSLGKRDTDVDTALSDRYTKTETDKAIGDKLTEIGAGDMQKAVYDTDGDGVVDNARMAENAAKLGGNRPAYYAKASSHNVVSYDLIHQLGLESTATITDVYNKMAEGSIYISDSYSFTGASWNIPNRYGSIIFIKAAGARSMLLWVSKGGETVKISMADSQTGIPTGEWKTVITEAGGEFKGKVSINYGNHADSSLYNMDVWESDGSTRVATQRIKLCRK